MRIDHLKEFKKVMLDYDTTTFHQMHNTDNPRTYKMGCSNCNVLQKAIWNSVFLVAFRWLLLVIYFNILFLKSISEFYCVVVIGHNFFSNLEAQDVYLKYLEF